MLNIKALFTEILKWINRDTSPKVLWSGGSYMLAAQTANLSETVQNQHHGIVLIWSGYYDGHAQDTDWFYQFVSKYHVSLHGGQGVGTGLMSNASATRIGSKYVYIYNNRITGNDANDDTGTTSGGITRSNNCWVLRYVLGV